MGTRIDVEETRNKVSKEIFNIKDTPAEYGDEWLTCNCVGDAINVITNTIIPEYEDAKGSLLNHLDELDEISREVINKMKDVVGSLSKLTVSDAFTGFATTIGLGVQVSSLLNANSNLENPRMIAEKEAQDKARRNYNLKQSLQNRTKSWSETSEPGSFGEDPRIKAEREAQDRARTEYQQKQQTETQQITKERVKPWAETSEQGTIGENPRIKAEREAQDRARTEYQQSNVTNNDQGNSTVNERMMAEKDAQENARGDYYQNQQTIKNNEVRDISSRNEAEKIASQQNVQAEQRNLQQIQNEKSNMNLRDKGYSSSITGQEGSISIQERNRQGMTATVTTKNSGLNIRAGKGTDTDIVGRLDKNSVITIKNDSRDGWAEVELADGTKGYVSTDYISYNKPTENITSGMTAKVNTNTRGLNIRLTPDHSNNSNILGSIPKGQDVTIIDPEIVTGSDGMKWVNVQYGDKKGYVSADWLSDYKNGE